MKTNNEQLTLQQQRFCDEYLVSFNAFQSALKAGYSEHTARKCELLHFPKVQAYLQAGMKRTSERLEISHDMILRELAKVAFANMGDYYNEKAVLKPMNELTPDQKAAICHYQLIDCVGDYGERAGELSKIKLHNKMSALDKIARHTGFYLVAGKKKTDVGGQMSEVERQSESQRSVSPGVKEEKLERDEALQTQTQVKHSLQTSASSDNGGEDKNILTLSPLEEEARTKMQESREEIPCENILTLSPPVGMEDRRGKMEDGIENILTLSPLNKVEKSFWAKPKCSAMAI